MDLTSILAAISLAIAGFAAKYPILVTVLTIVGMLRLIMKPLFSFLHEFVLITPSQADDALLSSVEGSKAFKVFAWILDYLGSIKLVK